MEQHLLDLIEVGKDSLQLIRAQRYNAEKMAEEQICKEKQQRWNEQLQPVYDLLPPDLAEFHVRYDVDAWASSDSIRRRMVWIDAIPGCNIYVGYNGMGNIAFFPQEAVCVRLNDCTDEFYVEYGNADDWGYTDILAALAHAVELADENLAMEAKAKEQTASAKSNPVAQVAKVKADPVADIKAMIVNGNYDGAIATALLLIAERLDDR